MTARKDESWDAFWREVSQGRTETICGVQVTVPTDLPLNLQRRLTELGDSEREEDVHELVALLFGDGVYDQWVDAGIGLLEFQVALAWGVAQASGQDLTFREAYQVVKDAQAGNLPAPPAGANRAARRQQSRSTGGPSKRTSSGSTASARRTSRA